MAQIGRLPATRDVGGLSDRGRRRRRNEDYWGRSEDSPLVRREQLEQYGRLYLVADGVGGNEDGDIASKEAVEQVMRRFYNAAYPADWTPKQRLERAISESSREIAVQIDKLQNNMAATLVAALIQDDVLTVANVGDSRAYLLRAAGGIEQVSVDHVENGNQLTQAMGDRRLDIASRELRLARNDVVVLCTDGLHDLVQAHELRRIVMGSPAHIAARRLIRLANRRAGHDNITVVIIRNGEPPRPIGLYLRGAGAAAAAAAAVTFLLGALSGIAPVQANRVNHYLGISRSSDARLEPTATLSALELKATATTVHIQAEAARGIVLPTLTPLPHPVQSTLKPSSVPARTTEPRLALATATPAGAPRSTQPQSPSPAAAAAPPTGPATAPSPTARIVPAPDNDGALPAPPVAAAPGVSTQPPAAAVPTRAVQAPPAAQPVPPTPMAEAEPPEQPNQPSSAPGRVTRPSPVPPAATAVPTSTRVPPTSTALPASTAVSATNTAVPTNAPPPTSAPAPASPPAPTATEPAPTTEPTKPAPKEEEPTAEPTEPGRPSVVPPSDPPGNTGN